MPLCTQHTWPFAIDEGVKPLRVKGQGGAEGKAFDPVFFGLGHVIGKAIEFLGPQRMILCPFKIKPPGIEDALRVNDAVGGFDDFGIGIQGP